jgi:hypothetical protein
VTDDQYRPIEGYPGYRVSRGGEVQSCWDRGSRWEQTDNWRPLTPLRRRGGYLGVNLSRGGIKVSRYVHRLVIEAFAGPRPEGMVCRHLDGDRTNNRADNLAWGTYSENEQDKVRHGTKAVGSRCNSKLTEAEVVEMRRLRAEGAKVRALASRYAVTASCVEGIVARRSWRHVP